LIRFSVTAQSVADLVGAKYLVTAVDVDLFDMQGNSACKSNIYFINNGAAQGGVNFLRMVYGIAGVGYVPKPGICARLFRRKADNRAGQIELQPGDAIDRRIGKS
jgi:hypothetical protein